MLTPPVASAPTNLMAVQEGLTSIRVSWSPPTPLGDTTGYRIYYSDGTSIDSVDISGGSTDNYLLTDFQNISYVISIVATSQHFFSSTVSVGKILGANECNFVGPVLGGAAAGSVCSVAVVMTVVMIVIYILRRCRRHHFIGGKKRCTMCLNIHIHNADDAYMTGSIQSFLNLSIKHMFYIIIISQGAQHHPYHWQQGLPGIKTDKNHRRW